MSGQLDLDVPLSANATDPVHATVEITHARAGADVQVTLAMLDGSFNGRALDSKRVLTTATGVATALFVLPLPAGVVTLVASATDLDDSTYFFDSDVETLRMI